MPKGEGFEGRQESEVIDKEIELLEHRVKPKNELEAQFLLAEELYTRDVESAPNTKDREVRNTIMINWGRSGYSAMFRRIFNEHPILRRDFSAITLAIVDQYVKEPHLLDNEIQKHAA